MFIGIYRCLVHNLILKYRKTKKRKNMEKLINILNNIKGNTIVYIEYISNVRMNKGGRQQSNTLYNHNVYRYIKTQLQLGNIYENSVNNRAEKECGVREFKTESIKGKKWVKFPYILTNMDESKIYIRFYKMKNANIESEIFVDGHKASNEELDIIKEYEISNKFHSQKQAESGLTMNQVEVKDININNIKRIVFNGNDIKSEDNLEYTEISA